MYSGTRGGPPSHHSRNQARSQNNEPGASSPYADTSEKSDKSYAKKKTNKRVRREHPLGIYPGRYVFVFLLLCLIVFAIIGKLLFLQVVDAGHLKRKAQQSRNQSLSLFNRGRILDKNGVILAQDTLVYDIYAHKKYFHKLKPAQIAQAIAPILGMDKENGVSRLTQLLSSEESTVTIKKNVPKAIVDKIQAARVDVIAKNPKTQETLIDEKTGQPVLKPSRITGLDFVKKPVRNYPQGTLAAHVLGYVNDEANLSSGVEETGKNILKNAPDMERAVLTGKGDVVQPESIAPEQLVNDPKAEDLVLTIDSRLQYLAERELAAGLKRTKSKRGTVVMMDPKTGEILAFASLPNYQPDKPFNFSEEIKKNWALTDVYPPGSTFKILTVACGLESGVINRQSKILDTGRMKMGGWKIENYDYRRRGAPGNIDLVYLLMHSSNIGSAKISMMIPKQKHYNLLKGFGLGEKTGIDLPAESSGIFHKPNTWDESTHGSLGYGYGLASTPMQMATAIAAIANDGMWITPHVMKNQKNVVTRRVLSHKTSQEMTDILIHSIQDAKTSSVTIPGIEVAGKTGTSKKPNDKGRGYGSNVFTSFVGYYPARNPKALMMVVMDSPGIGDAWGSTVAGPIFRAIATESISYLGLKPAKIIAKPKPSHANSTH